MSTTFKQKIESKNYYEILEIPYDSTQEEISEAYYRSKNTYVRDNIALHSLMGKNECNAIVEMVEEAYSVLGESSKRLAYDKARGFGRKTPSDFDMKEKSKIFFELEKNIALSTVKEGKFSTIHREAEVSKIAAVNRFSLDYAPNPQIEEEIEACQEFTGAFLRRIREYKGVGIPRLSNMTKISKTYLKNIEDEDFDGLPALAYVRGFVYQYAKTLKLNPDYVANSYIAKMKMKKKKIGK